MIDVTRVYYDLPEDLHREAKSAAAWEGMSLRLYLIDALREAVAKTDEKRMAAKAERERQASGDGH